jgi:hypothetical protein
MDQLINYFFKVLSAKHRSKEDFEAFFCFLINMAYKKAAILIQNLILTPKDSKEIS